MVSENMPTPCSEFNNEYFNVFDLFSDYEELIESSRLFSVIESDKESIGEYKCGYSFDFQPAVPTETQFQGVSNLFLEFDNIHFSFVKESYQFDPGIFMHADPCFHSEHFVKEVPSMHHENQGSYFIFPAELIQNFDVFGEIDGKLFSNLPQSSKSQNQVFDKGNKFGEVSVALGHLVQ